jgi:hypothetical protein
MVRMLKRESRGKDVAMITYIESSKKTRFKPVGSMLKYPETECLQMRTTFVIYDITSPLSLSGLAQACAQGWHYLFLRCLEL